LRTTSTSTWAVVDEPLLALVGDVFGARAEGHVEELLLGGGLLGERICPLRSKAQLAVPAAPMVAPAFSKILRSSATVRLRLSVRTSTRKRVPPGPVPS
jgi:hypothetical protein